MKKILMGTAVFLFVTAVQAAVTITIPGDYDRDCDVDGADHILFQQQIGKTVKPFAGADGNGDGTVNAPDLSIWQENFGHNEPGCPSSTAPDPIVSPAPTPAPAPISPPDTKNYIRPNRGEIYTLTLNLDTARRVRIDIYTLQGDKVLNVVDADLAAGTHSVSWNGRNEKGSVVASDVYAVLLYENGHLTQKKKVIIQR